MSFYQTEGKFTIKLKDFDNTTKLTVSNFDIYKLPPSKRTGFLYLSLI